MNRGQRPHEPLEVRLDRLSEWEPMSGCRLWLGATIWNGYGRIKVGVKNVLAHRAAYEDATGSPIPAGLTIDHRCRNRLCINRAHLEAVTQQENVHRGEGVAGQHFRKDACSRGHAFTPENTLTGRKPGWRVCRTCKKSHSRATKQRARAKSPLTFQPLSPCNALNG